MDPETFSTHQLTRTIQEDTRLKNMYPATFTARRSTRTIQEDTRVQNMDLEE